MRSTTSRTPVACRPRAVFAPGAGLLAAFFVSLLILPAPAPLLGQPDDDHAGHDHEKEHEEGHEEAVQLNSAELQEFGIVVSEAGPATIQLCLDLPGEIQVNDNQLAHIVPRFSGIVTDVRVRIGDRVGAGQVLAMIESDESLSPYEMKTLISGTIIDKHITLGEAVSREHAAFVVADLSSVWVDITVYQRDLSRVATGQTVFISGGHGLPDVTGEISYVAPIVREKTRTAIARATLSNPDGIWRPGTFITARIIVDRFEVPVAVPGTALQMMEGQNVVFVETEEGFHPRPVTPGRAGRDNIEIIAGLARGERYVSQGGFTLKAEMGKESFGGGHAH